MNRPTHLVRLLILVIASGFVGFEVTQFCSRGSSDPGIGTVGALVGLIVFECVIYYFAGSLFGESTESACSRARDEHLAISQRAARESGSDFEGYRARLKEYGRYSSSGYNEDIPIYVPFVVAAVGYVAGWVLLGFRLKWF